ncbi:MAG: endonuclease Q family protein [bacterium]
MHKIEFMDLHLHTKYSLASSKNGGIESFSEMARLKGVSYLGTGDILHGGYFKEAKKKLKEEGYGIYFFSSVKFFLTAEVSLIYRENDKCRKIHILLVFPDYLSVEEARKFLKDYAKLESDGRPIVKLNIRDFILKMKNISEDILVIMAHIWTPHFSILGGKSGYDSIPAEVKESISALETGLSSDPFMCCENKDASLYPLVSFSDAHSPQLIGREATIVEGGLKTIKDLKRILSLNKIYGTVEFFPQEGKYFLSGHRNCGFKTGESINVCPICRKNLTEGVFNRIKSLPKSKKIYDKKVFYVLPIEEYVNKFVLTSKNKIKKPEALIKMLERKSEMEIKVTADRRSLAETFTEEFAQFCINVRNKNVEIEEGYDGVFGKIKASEVR